MNNLDLPSARTPTTVRRGLQITGVATVAAVGGMRLLYEDYYRALGVDLDEVGLSSWRMLTYPMSGAVGMAGLLAVAVFGGVVAGRCYGTDAGLGVGGATFALLGVLFGFLPPSWGAATAIVAGAFALTLAFGPPSVADRRWTLVLCQHVFLWIALGVAAFAWVAALAGAAGAASDLRITGDAGHSFASAVLDVRASPVCAVASDQDSAVRLPHRPLLLLGSADGRTVLWDPAHRRPLRVPTSAVFLLEPNAAPCH